MSPISDETSSIFLISVPQTKLEPRFPECKTVPGPSRSHDSDQNVAGKAGNSEAGRSPPPSATAPSPNRHTVEAFFLGPIILQSKPTTFKLRKKQRPNRGLMG